MRVPTPAALVPFGPQKRPSPTPSIKRGKAEKLLKEHGSPPGLRVTAGGRIVPSDLQPLGTSRYGDTTYRPQPPLRVAPGNIMQTRTQSNDNNTARVEVVGGQPVIFVGDRMFALPAVNATNSTMPPTGPAAMDPMTKQMLDASTMSAHGTQSGPAFGPSRSSTRTPFAGLDLTTLKTQQALKKHELRTVEQTEVLQAGHQSEAWRAGMIEKKRCLIVELDALRKQITALESDGSTTQHGAFPRANGIGSASIPPGGPQFQHPFAPAMYPYAAPYSSMPMFQPQPQPFSTLPSFSAEPAPFVPAASNPPHSPPGSASRRSKAIEIKPPPPEEVKRGSALNPKSPTYEPATKSKIAQGAVPPAPSPEKRSPWEAQQMPETGKHGRRVSSQKHSLSSIDTMDFFPTNTHEHSSTRVAPQVKETDQSSNENTAVPSTPEKHWPASPWNEGDSGRSRNNDPTPKLTSWPEAFGKQPSLISIQQTASEQPFSIMIKRAPAMGASTSTSASSSVMAPQTHYDQRTGSDENWSFNGKPVAHVPSTYQEGYQAGYEHVGIPDSPEVLQGYIQGLLHFLTDESKKRQAEYQRGANSRTPSLRALVAGSLPQDSAVGMSFKRNSTNGGQESVRSAKNNPPDDVRRDSGYDQQGNVKNIPVQYTIRNEVAQERHRVASTAQYLKPPVVFPQRMVSGYRQAVFPSIEDDMNRGIQSKSVASRSEVISNGGVSHQSFGNQIQNRTYSTSLNMQRFYPTPKELGPSELGGYGAPTPRHFGNHRMSGLDGAMDDLSEMINDTHIDERRSSVAVDNRSAEAPISVEYEESNANCFKVSSSSKGKQKATSSPAKGMDAERDTAASSPANPPSSPKKSGEHSPAKAKLEQVTNKFRRSKKDDPRTMSPDERKTRSDKWRQRFRELKRTEIEEIEAHRGNSRT